jgi:eukaryotic-like serine/threonine-protein kinase
LLGQDEADRLLALRLEEARLVMASLVGDQFNYSGAAQAYEKAFAEGGFQTLRADAQDTAARIAASAIKEQLVAAVDDWAYPSAMIKKDDLAKRLLEVARRADPDPAWRDKLRRLETWLDRDALAALTRQPPPGGGLVPPDACPGGHPASVQRSGQRVLAAPGPGSVPG